VKKLASKYAQESAEQLEDDEEYSLADENIHETTVSGDRADDELDSPQALRTAYRSLLDVLTSATIAPGDDRTCPLCLEDDTINVPFVGKGAFKLQRHIDSNQHTSASRYKRKYKHLEQAGRRHIAFSCPYGCHRTYSS
jgi:hypothetical protein